MAACLDQQIHTGYPLGPHPMRITTWNVHFGKRIEAIVEAFRQNANLAKSDIVLLQEIESYPEEGRARAEAVAEHLGYYCVYAPARSKGKNGSHGIAILSRFPIEHSEIIELPFARLLWGSKRRIALIAKVQTPHGSVIVCNVHLDVRINHRVRIQQLHGVIEKLRAYSSCPLIVGGDFNTSPFYFAFSGLFVLPYSQRKRVERYMSVNGFHGLPRVPRSYRPPVIPMRLDNIFVSGAHLERCGVEKRVRVSDHRPVWADLGTV